MILGRKEYTISAGNLKDRLTLLMPSATSDGRGGSRITYSSYASVWCQAKNANNSRELAAAQLTFVDAQIFIIRVTSVPITANWHITFQGREYTIQTILDIENRYQYYKILAYSKDI
jgi:SPP1 family predicted phage head-tail adaptor